MNRQALSSSLKKKVLSNITSYKIRQYMMVGVLLVIWLIFSILTNSLFTSSRNLSNLFMQMCTIGILSCGMVFIMVTGNIDISVGSVLGTLGALFAILTLKLGLSPLVTIPITLFAGICVGLWHGYWIAYRQVPAMIATLASMTAFKGLTLGLTGGVTIGGFSVLVKLIGQGYLPQLFFKGAAFNDFSILIVSAFIIGFVILDQYKRATRIKYGFKVAGIMATVAREAIVAIAIGSVGFIMISYRGIPYAIIILLAVAFVWTYVGNFTPFGRSIYAIGGNKEAARLSGINIKQNLVFIYGMMGFLNAVAAIVFTTRLNAATTSAGTSFEMDAIAAAVIGGTSPAGGVGTVFGAIIGALIMASLDNGMSLLNVNIMYQYVIKGLVLLVAVAVDAASKK